MDLHYLLHQPENITEETPLLVLLHGYGSNEEDLFSFVPTLPQDWLIVSLRAPKSMEYEGFAWYDIDFNDPEKFVETSQATEALNAILRLIENVKQQFATKGNVHLAGFSQGGVLSYALALTFPHKFSKVACMSCYPEEKLLGKISKNKKDLENLRFFISHGIDDAIIPLDWGRKAADLLYDLGCYFSFREYMAGHTVNQKNYMDLMDFLNK